MMVASAARTWWARRPWRGQAGPSAFGRTTARITTFTLLVLSLAVIACAAAGLTTTLRNDLRQAAERHRMLQATLSELRGTLSADGRFDHAQLGVIERRTGLNDLRFDSDLAADAGREVQSLHDGQGRIVGWFSWMPDRSLITSMNRLWGVVGAVGLLLVVAAVVALQTTQRLSRSVARSADTIRKLTTQDSLTGLPNRRVMLDRLDQVVAGRAGGVVVFALIDIDGFHDVNETLGWAGGNAMLASIADRFKARLPAGAILGRFQDDEFAVIAGGRETGVAAALVEAISAALAAPIFMDQMWQISVSIGLAQAPEDGVTGDELSRRAALALRAAKRRGRGSVRRVVPLLRWTHPTRGPIAPSMFIPLAEESGLMNGLGEIALRRALADGARWPNLFVSVNLSPVQMGSPGLIESIRMALAQNDMAATRVVLEVTEGILIDNPEETLAKLEALRALGVSTALDDFGNGY